MTWMLKFELKRCRARVYLSGESWLFVLAFSGHASLS
jgi:hypothetical protein